MKNCIFKTNFGRRFACWSKFLKIAQIVPSVVKFDERLTPLPILLIENVQKVFELKELMNERIRFSMRLQKNHHRMKNKQQLQEKHFALQALL